MEIPKSETSDLKSGSGESERKTFGRTLALCEIVSLVISVVITEWAVLPLAGRNLYIGAVPVALVFALIIYSHHVRGETWRDLGWRIDNFAEAARLLLLPTIIATVFLFIAGWFLRSSGIGTTRARSWSVWLPLFGVMWGLLQQYALQSFVNRRAQEVWGRGTASVLVTASVFGFLHLPNLWLTLATFIIGYVWAFVYQRTPNLLALAITHSLLTFILIWNIPDVLLGGLRVGYNYFL